MDLGDDNANAGATVVGGKRLSRDETVKIRMSGPELDLLDKIKDSHGFATRATTIRFLMKSEQELTRSARIVELNRQRARIEQELTALGG